MSDDDMETFSDEWGVEDTRNQVRRCSIDGCKTVAWAYEPDAAVRCPAHGDCPTVFVHSH
jgi:hypothetical protein